MLEFLKISTTYTSVYSSNIKPTKESMQNKFLITTNLAFLEIEMGVSIKKCSIILFLIIWRKPTTRST